MTESKNVNKGKKNRQGGSVPIPRRSLQAQLHQILSSMGAPESISRLLYNVGLLKSGSNERAKMRKYAALRLRERGIDRWKCSEGKQGRLVDEGRLSRDHTGDSGHVPLGGETISSRDREWRTG